MSTKTLTFETALIMAAKALSGHLTLTGTPSIILALKAALSGKNAQERILAILYLTWRETEGRGEPWYPILNDKGKPAYAADKPFIFRIAPFLSSEGAVVISTLCAPDEDLVSHLKLADTPIANLTLILVLDTYEDGALKNYLKPPNQDSRL